MNKKISNKQIIYRIMVAIVIIALMSITFYYLLVPKKISLNGVVLSHEDYEAIQKQFKDSPLIRICNFENKQCIVMAKLPSSSETSSGGV